MAWRTYGLGAGVQATPARSVTLAISFPVLPMRFRSAFLGFVPVLVLWSLASALPRGTPKPRPQLAGSWQLNPERSRSPGAGMRRGPGGGGGRRPGGESPGDFGEEVQRPVLGEGNRGLGELLRPKQHLVITQSDTLLTIADDAGWIRELIPTGQWMREELGQGGPADVVTRWSGTKLVAERRLDRGGTYQETYQLDGKATRLTVKLNYKTERMPRAFESSRVYEREGGEIR